MWLLNRNYYSLVCKDNRNYIRVCNIDNNAEYYNVYQIDPNYIHVTHINRKMFVVKSVLVERL